MSTYSMPNDAFDPYGPARPMSGLAIASLICSLAGILTCGITSLLGTILGLIGVITLGPSAPKRGRGVATAGLILGILISVAWAVGATVLFAKLGGIIRFVMTGPNDALTLGFNGNVAGFKSSFTSPGATAPDAEAQAFLDELTQRYGVFSAAALPQGQNSQPQQTPGQPTILMPYKLQFSNGSVDAWCELQVANPQTGNLKEQKLVFIHILDASKGELWYPASAATNPAPPILVPSSGADPDSDADADAEPAEDDASGDQP